MLCAVVKPQTQAPGLGPRLLLVRPVFPPLALRTTCTWDRFFTSHSVRIFWTIHEGQLRWSVTCSRTYTTYLQLLYMFTIPYYRGCTKHVRYSGVNNGLVYPQILWTKGYVVYTAVWFLLNKLLLLLCVLLVLILDFYRTGAVVCMLNIMFQNLRDFNFENLVVQWETAWITKYRRGGGRGTALLFLKLRN